MNGYIQQIKTKIPYSDKEINIDLQGRNLIFTGGNGCGKTQLLNFIHNELEKRIVQKQNPNKKGLEKQKKSYENLLATTSKADSNYESFQYSLTNIEKQIDDINNPPLVINNLEQYVISYHNKKALLSKFDATRQANIQVSNSAISKNDLIAQVKYSINNTAMYFEQYLVSIKTIQAYAESPSIDNNPEEAERIKNWFIKLRNDFQELFEDESLELVFDSKNQAFFIKQERKEAYRFQQLSSGFSSILSVYADLLTTVELRSIAPDEIDGVVFIDEIDAHLHVSLQRKILSFLVKAFPKVQFIVTTHSPFVVLSVNDAVIYDLSRLEEIDDLSLYSYESVLEGLFNVLPISEILKSKIEEISELTNTDNTDLSRLEQLVTEVSQHESKLDSESAYFLKVAKITLNKTQG